MRYFSCLLFFVLFAYSSYAQEKYTITGYVINVEEEKVYLDLSSAKVKVGDKVKVLSDKGYFIHPVTKRKIERAQEELATLSIVKVYDSYSEAIPVHRNDLKNIKVGYCVEFGKYPYWQQGREEPLVWRVLDIQGDKALLVSNKVVDYLPAADSLDCSSWKDSFLATWLNSVFYVKAFNNMEMARLVINRSVNQFITVPSTEELILYYSDNPKSHLPSFAEGKAKALQTPYVTDKNKESENRYITWWLRDFMIGKGRVKYVSKDGRLVEPRFDGEAMKSKGV